MNGSHDLKVERVDSVSKVQSVGARSEALCGTFQAGLSAGHVLRFGVFELDRRTLELRREGRLIHLRHQPVQVLTMLIERSGELVMRAEITDALWPQDLDVDVEQGLNHCIKEIRAALGDKAESPRYVQTLPRRGYRMLAEVQGLRGLPTAGPSDEVTVPAPVAGSGLREAPGNEDDEPVGFGKGFE